MHKKKVELRISLDRDYCSKRTYPLEESTEGMHYDEFDLCKPFVVEDRSNDTTYCVIDTISSKK